MHPPRPKRRFEPMLLLVLGLPASAVAAGIATLVVALRAGGADAVADPVRRTAQIQQVDTHPDLRAAELRLDARIELDRATGAVTVTLARPVSTRRLALSMYHPIEADRDTGTALVGDGSRFFGRVAPARNAWTLALAPEDGSWRIGGRLAVGAASAQLRPRFETATR